MKIFPFFNETNSLIKSWISPSRDLLEISTDSDDFKTVENLLRGETKTQDIYLHGVISKQHSDSASLESRVISSALSLLGYKFQSKLNTSSSLTGSLQANAIRYRKINNEAFPLEDAFGLLITTYSESSEKYGILSNFGETLKLSIHTIESVHNITSKESIQSELDQSSELYELYPPLPFKLENLIDFISFVFKSFTKDLLIIALLTGFANSLQILFPLLTVYVASNVINLGSISLALQVGFLAVLLTAISAGTLFIQSQFILKLEAESDKKAQMGLWDRLLKAKLDTIEKYDPVDLSYRVAAISEIKEIVSAGNIISLLNVVFSVFYFATMYYFLPSAVIAILPIILIFLISVIRKALSGGELLGNSLAAKARLGFVAQQLLDILPEIRVRGLTDKYLEEWSKYLGDLTRFRNKYRKKDNSIMLLQSSFQPLCFLVSFVVIFSDPTSFFSDNNNLISLLGYTSALTLFCSQLGGGALTVANSFVEVLAYWNRSSPIIFTQIEPGYGPNLIPAELKGQLSFDNVTFSYFKDSSNILNNLTFSVDKSSFVYLDIPRGTGSSTIGNLLMSLYKPDSGSISFDGIEQNNFNISSFRSQLSLIPQNPYVPTSLLGDLFDTPYTKDDEDLYDLLKSTSLLDMINNLRLGLNTPVTENAGSFSTVERQLLSIASIISKHPVIVYFDDCTSSLSLKQKLSIFDYLKRYGATVIVRDSYLTNTDFPFNKTITI
jgi:ABC-type bacteriocin/lantibiotic exporter with double-glycine peptidase domain